MYYLHVCVVLCIAVSAPMSSSQRPMPEEIAYHSMTPEVCRLLPETGNCPTRVRRFYYNVTSGQCEPFAYSGCGGNENRFETVNACVSACVCSQSEMPVSCASYNAVREKPTYFNAMTGQCKTMPPGTCQGNRNAFSSMAVCRDTCSLCNLAKDIGPCKGRYPRYHFNRAAGQCQIFSYGGCGGNRNNFLTKGACEHTCSRYIPFSVSLVSTLSPATKKWTFNLSRTLSQSGGRFQGRRALINDPSAASLPQFVESGSYVLQRSPRAGELYELPEVASEEPVAEEQQESLESAVPAAAPVRQGASSMKDRMSNNPGRFRFRLTFKRQSNSLSNPERQIFTGLVQRSRFVRSTASQRHVLAQEGLTELVQEWPRLVRSTV